MSGTGDSPIDYWALAGGGKTLRKEFSVSQYIDDMAFAQGLDRMHREGWKLHSWQRNEGRFYAVYERN